MVNYALKKRFSLFLFGCIPMRLALAALAYYGSKWIVNTLALVALMISIGFMVIFLGGFRTRGIETGGELIWWNAIRPIHAFLYLAFGIMVFTGMRHHAWKALLFDAIFGLSAFLYFHFVKGDFDKLLK
jgi:hypothetical protein